MVDPELDVVDLSRDGRWCQVLLGPAAAVAQVENGPFVGVVSADLGPDAGAALASLRPALREIVCFDSVSEPTGSEPTGSEPTGSEPTVSGQDFAMAQLERGGFGQDFVFTVPLLEDAIEYALATLLKDDQDNGEGGGWEGRSVVVIGPPAVLDRAGRHLTGT